MADGRGPRSCMCSCVSGRCSTRGLLWDCKDEYAGALGHLSRTRAPRLFGRRRLRPSDGPGEPSSRLARSAAGAQQRGIACGVRTLILRLPHRPFLFGGHHLSVHGSSPRGPGWITWLADASARIRGQPWRCRSSRRDAERPSRRWSARTALSELPGCTHSRLAYRGSPGECCARCIAKLDVRPSTEALTEAYYWATHQGAEIDLILFKSGSRIGVECKRTDAPKVTPSKRIALADLKLDRIHGVYPEKT